MPVDEVQRVLWAEQGRRPKNQNLRPGILHASCLMNY